VKAGFTADIASLFLPRISGRSYASLRNISLNFLASFRRHGAQDQFHSLNAAARWVAVT